MIVGIISVGVMTVGVLSVGVMTLSQSYNDGMVNPEVVCHPSMAKTTAMHANSLPPFCYG